MTQVSATSSVRIAQLSPTVMAKAGVPFRDALWFTRIPAGRPKAQALGTPTGKRLLERVTAFMMKSDSALPAPA